MGKVELLAPAGSMESLYAGVENGADAVYLGGKFFNARQHASNFEDDELKEAVSYAHKRGVSIYVTMNISLKQEELNQVTEYLDFLYEIGVDALIIQDLGLFKLIKERYPDFPVHGSTQMTIHNSYGVNHLKKSGFSRAVLARELSYDEIETVSNNTELDLEVFVHGALCVSYSGQCLISSMIGGRSGNRGTCAQTCRMPFSVERTRDQRKIESKGNYILSTKDLNTLEEVGKLIELGVKSFKIEGRMKKPEYVATVVSKYRKAIDKYIAQKDSQASEEDKFELEQIFNRGFTKGLLGGDFGESFISLDKPNNRGVYLGEVLDVRGRKVTLRLKADIVLCDGVSIESESRESGSASIDRIYSNRKAVDSANKGQLVALDLYAKVSAGDKLYKTYDKLLSQKAKMSYENIELEKQPLDLELKIVIGEKPRLKAYFDSEEFIAESEKKVEIAAKNSLTKEKVEEQISKFGNSDYVLKSLELQLEEKSFLPLSVLNELRRSLTEQIDEYRIKKDNRMVEMINPFKEELSEGFAYKETKLSAKLESLEQLPFLDLKKLSRVYIPMGENIEQHIEKIKREDVEVYLSTDKIVMDSEFKKLNKDISSLRSSIDGVLVGNLGSFDYVGSNFSELKLQLDSGLNVLNAESAKYLNHFRASGVTLSPELTFKEIDELTKSYEFEYEAIAYGYLQLMTMKHCPMSLFKRCGSDRDCEICEFREGYEIVDRKDMRFRVSRKKDLTTIYNSQRLFIPEHMDKFENSRISHARLDFTVERSEIKEIQNLYSGALEGSIGRADIENYIVEIGEKSNFTKGHYFRGIV